MMTTYRLLCSIKTKSIAEPPPCGLLLCGKICSIKIVSQKNPKKKKCSPQAQKIKKRLSIVAGRCDREGRLVRSCAAGRPRRRRLGQRHASSADGAARDRCGFFPGWASRKCPVRSLARAWTAGAAASRFRRPRVSPPPPVLVFDTANLEARATPPGVVVGRV